MGHDFNRSRRHFLLYMHLIGIIIICSIAVGIQMSSSKVAFARSAATFADRFLSGSCQSSVVPTSQSLLVVLLDRSGSLTQGSSPTDPKQYSTSVTKALADLWPGNMAVIPFSGDTMPLAILGPANLTDPVQRADLKQKIQDYPIGGDTPLKPAMQQALELLHQKGSPAGSRVMVITDGNPTGLGDNDGPHQEDAIRKDLIPQYCQQGLPVSTFGLTIAANTADGRDANRLLSDIAIGTGTSYTNVTSPEDLGKQVTRLYAEWQGLTFTQLKGQGGNFLASIDSFAQQVAFVSFRSDQQYHIRLIGPNNQPVTTGIQQSTDNHYEIDKLVIAGPIQPGTYTINTNSDPNAQVYVLVNSPLQVKLVAPTSSTIAYADKPVHIEAEFVNGSESITDKAQIVAKVTLLVNGRPAGPPTNDIVLVQQSNSPIFSGQTLVYNQPGDLQIELYGTYQNVQRQSSSSVQLLPEPAPPCGPSCMAQRQALITSSIIGLILLALTALLVWALIVWQRSLPKPYGYVTNGKKEGDVELERFKKAVISSDDLLRRGNFDFRSASFELIFLKGGTVQIRTTKHNGSPVTIDHPKEPKPVTETPIELKAGQKICVGGVKAASFESTPGKLWR